MSDRRVPYHCIHTIKETFDPSVLEGRTILPDQWKPDQKTVGFDQVFLEGREDDNIVAHITSIGSGFFIDIEPNKVFTDGLRVTAVDKQGNSAPFISKGDHGKLVITKDDEVVGIVYGFIEKDGKQETMLIPAYAFIEAPYEPIIELLKKQFDKSVLDGRNVAENPRSFEGGWVSVDGRPAIAETLDYDYKINIDGQEYRFLQRVHSYYPNKDSSDTGLKSAFDSCLIQPEDGRHYVSETLFSRPDDVGKLVVSRDKIHSPYNSDEEIVIGIIIGSEEKYSVNHERWYQKTYIAPASDFLIK